MIIKSLMLVIIALSSFAAQGMIFGKKIIRVVEYSDDKKTSYMAILEDMEKVNAIKLKDSGEIHCTAGKGFNITTLPSDHAGLFNILKHQYEKTHNKEIEKISQ